MTLLDILLAIVIFVVGMLALASLQGNLSRSSADANVRTVGTNIAEEIIEGLRSIQDIQLPAGQACAADLAQIATDDIYECIVDGAQATIPHTNAAGDIVVNYDVVAAVTDYYLMEDGVSVTSNVGDLPPEWNTDISSYKMVELTVTWADANSVAFIDAPEDNPLLGSGSFTVSAIIPSLPNIGSAQIAKAENEDTGPPLIEYLPGLRPDIIAIGVEGDKFKESTTPMPDVVRSDELVETWFDVITYNQANNGTTFLRREEFLVISCECQLKLPDANNQGLMPTVWNGTEYSEERWVTKAYGVSANNQQSPFCDTCCRDHHDPANVVTDDDVYDPSRGGGNPQWSEPVNNGDHKHYRRANQGGLALANNNSTYVEACRMVRKDGFMRVAQDFRQEGFFGFPEGYLETDAGVAEYGSYVTTSVDDMYGVAKNAYAISQNMLNDPVTYGITFPASTDMNATVLPFLMDANSQQLRSRGVYVDQLSPAASGLAKCLMGYEGGYDPNGAPPNPTPGEQCAADGFCELESCRAITHHRQVLPFYEVQTTWLNWWNMNEVPNPVSVTNEAVADDNAHSRGLAVLEVPNVEPTLVWTMLDMHRGNIGLTVTDDITLEDVAGTGDTDYDVYIAVNGAGGGELPVGYTWDSITGSAVNKVDFADVVIVENGNVICSRTADTLACFTPDGEDGSIDLSGYTKNIGNPNDPNYLDLYICVDDQGGVSTLSVENRPDGVNNSATISWTDMPADVGGIVISIEDAICP